MLHLFHLRAFVDQWRYFYPCLDCICSRQDLDFLPIQFSHFEASEFLPWKVNNCTAAEIYITWLLNKLQLSSDQVLGLQSIRLSVAFHNSASSLKFFQFIFSCKICKQSFINDDYSLLDPSPTESFQISIADLRWVVSERHNSLFCGLIEGISRILYSCEIWRWQRGNV